MKQTAPNSSAAFQFLGFDCHSLEVMTTVRTAHGKRKVSAAKTNLNNGDGSIKDSNYSG